MHHARAAQADGAGDLVGVQAAAQQAERRAATAQLGRGAREQLGRLVELLADEPQQVLHGALLAAGRAVAVVQEQDHRGKPRLSRR